jgi:hypothetical protein
MPLNENVTISIFREAAAHLAKLWSQFVRPMPFEATFFINGIRVEVRVNELKTDQDTKPFGRAE